MDYIQNVHKMCKVAGQIRKMGHAPYVPALDLLLGVINGDWAEKEYRGLGMEFMEVCDAVLVISTSWGVEEELEEARKLCIPIYYSIVALYHGSVRQAEEEFLSMLN